MVALRTNPRCEGLPFSATAYDFTAVDLSAAGDLRFPCAIAESTIGIR